MPEEGSIRDGVIFARSEVMIVSADVHDVHNAFDVAVGSGNFVVVEATNWSLVLNRIDVASEEPVDVSGDCTDCGSLEVAGEVFIMDGEHPDYASTILQHPVEPGAYLAMAWRNDDGRVDRIAVRRKETQDAHTDTRR
jgi:hypothetical protein